MRQVTATGRAFIESNEGKKYIAYYDQAGIITNGIGHTGTDVFPGQHVNDAQIDKWLANDLGSAENTVETSVKVPLTDPEFDALVDFCYNIGDEAFAKSTLVRLLNAGNAQAADDQFMDWIYITDPKTKLKVKDDGLVNRRLKEQHLFATGIVPDHIASLPVSNVVPTPPEQTHPATSKTLWAQMVAGAATLWEFVSSAFDNVQGTDVQAAADKAGGFIQYGEKFKYIFFGLSGLAIAFTFIERLRKLKEGK